MSGASRPNRDTTANELRVIDLITQHDVSVDEGVTRHSNFRPGPITAVQQPLVEFLQMLIACDSLVSGFDKQEA